MFPVEGLDLITEPFEFAAVRMFAQLREHLLLLPVHVMAGPGNQPLDQLAQALTAGVGVGNATEYRGSIGPCPPVLLDELIAAWEKLAGDTVQALGLRFPVPHQLANERGGCVVALASSRLGDALKVPEHALNLAVVPDEDSDQVKSGILGHLELQQRQAAHMTTAFATCPVCLWQTQAFIDRDWDPRRGQSHRWSILAVSMPLLQRPTRL